MERNGREIDDVAQAQRIVDDDVVDDASRIRRVDAEGPKPGRRKMRRVLLIERLSVDPVWKPREHERPIAKVRKQQGRDGVVVRKQIALGISVRLPKDFGEITELNDPLVGRRLLPAPPPLALRDLATTRDRQLVDTQPQERRVPKAAVVRPLGEPHFAHESRRDPRVSAPGGRSACERRSRTPQRLQALEDGIERRVVEAGADAPDVDEGVALVEADVEGAEACARSLRRRVAADDELLAEMALDLDPVPRPAAGIYARRALRHDALDALLAGGVVERLAVLEHVRAVLDDAARGHEQRQALLARRERQRTQIAPVERQRIEEHRGHGRGAARALDVGGTREMHARLQALETRAPALVERDDLAIEHEAVERQRAEGGDDLRIARRERLTGASMEIDRVTVTRREDAHAVVLHLEEPAGPRERARRQRGQHHGLLRGRDTSGRSAQRGEPLAQGREARRRRTQLLDGPAREDRFRIALGRLVASFVGIGVLEEEPVPATRGAYEREAPAKLHTEELDLDPPARELRIERFGLRGAIPAAIPDDHLTGAVVAEIGRAHV